MSFVYVICSGQKSRSCLTLRKDLGNSEDVWNSSQNLILVTIFRCDVTPRCNQHVTMRHNILKTLYVVQQFFMVECFLKSPSDNKKASPVAQIVTVTGSYLSKIIFITQPLVAHRGEIRNKLVCLIQDNIRICYLDGENIYI